MTDFTSFDAAVDAQAGDVLAQLSAFCRIPSVSAESGPAMLDAAAFVQTLCRAAGVQTALAEQPSGPPIIIGRAGSGDRCLMVYNHYDVQPPDPLDEWLSPAFEPQARDGKLYARGVADNKGDLVARLAAIRIYQETVGPLPLRVLYIFEGEEEIGSPFLFHFGEEQGALLSEADGCLWEFGSKDADGNPVICLGVKGMAAFDLRVRTATLDAHSGNGGIFPNAAWRLTEALNSLRAPDGQVIIDGLQAHVRPPTDVELRLLEDVPFNQEALQSSYGFANGLLGGLTGAAAVRRWLMEPALNVNAILSGYSGPGTKTVIPAQATAKMDMRLVPDLTPQIAFGLLRDHLDRRGFSDVEIIDHNDYLMPWRTSPDSAIAQAVAASIAAVGEHRPIVQPTSPGSGPMWELCGRNGVPVASAGVSWHDCHVHAPNESIRIADFVEGVKVMGRLLERFAEEHAAT